MTEWWRTISSDEAALIRTVVSAANIPGSDALVDNLDAALMSHATEWILDVYPSTSARTTLPNGPFPVHAYVPSRADHRGEIIIWLTGGRISGLEYAWTTDEPPERWPAPEEIEVVPDDQ